MAKNIPTAREVMMGVLSSHGVQKADKIVEAILASLSVLEPSDSALILSPEDGGAQISLLLPNKGDSEEVDVHEAFVTALFLRGHDPEFKHDMLSWLEQRMAASREAES